MVDKYAAIHYQDVVLPNLIKDYHPDDIINADETALYYKALPDRTYQYKNKKADDIQFRKSDYLCYYPAIGQVPTNFSQWLLEILKIQDVLPNATKRTCRLIIGTTKMPG